MMGNSGSILKARAGSMWKSGGGQDLKREGNLLQHLGSSVGPEFLGWSEDGGYVMELCTPYPPTKDQPEVYSLLTVILDHLYNEVWPNPSWYETPDWSKHNLHWLMEHASWIPLSLANEVYLRERTSCLTHGDPTLSNVVLRKKTDRLLLCDPLPPRPEFPSTRSVDYGKMLQSLAGWEHQLNPEWFKSSVTKWAFESLIPRDYHLTSLFWAAFHCARIAVRSPKHARWARLTSQDFTERALNV